MMRAPVLLLAFGFLAACADPETRPAPQPPAIVALYGEQAETDLTPYPSNRYAREDGSSATGLRVQLTAETTADSSVSAYASTVEQLNAMDGFSTTGGVIVMFSGPIELRGLVTDPDAEPPIVEPPRDANDFTKADSPLILIDVDEASPERGKAFGLIPRFWGTPKDDYYPTDDFTLVAQPATPLRPATRYLFVVTRSLAAASGGAVERSPLSEALLGGAPSDGYASEVQAGLDVLEASVGVARDDVVLATSFTTASVLSDMVATAKRARASAAPAVTKDWEVEQTSDSDDRVRFKAVFDTPEYRKPSPDGKWVIQDGAPIEQARVGLEVFLAFSDATKSGPRPVVIYAHGLGGTKDGSWGTSERLGALNAAVFSIDSPEHGSRSADPENGLAATFAFFGIDGDDQSFDIGRARDNFRQMGSDQLELVRLIASLGDLDLLPVGAPDGVADLDVSRVLYIGHSFGSVQGPLVFALAPEITQATWNVGGDGMMTLLRDSGTFSVLVNALRPPMTPDGALGRFFAMTQAIVDPGDPLNYARFGAIEALEGVPSWAPRDMLVQEVIADNIVPNSTSEALARAAGLVLMDPIAPITGLPSASGPLTGNLASGATGAISQFDRMDGGAVATHGSLIFSPEAQAQYVRFFDTGLSNGHATIEPPY